MDAVEIAAQRLIATHRQEPEGWCRCGSQFPCESATVARFALTASAELETVRRERDRMQAAIEKELWQFDHFPAIDPHHQHIVEGMKRDLRTALASTQEGGATT